MRILVAEDERDLNEIICRHLEREGYSVDSCHNGDEAIAILSYTEYDAVVLDIMMPGADGFYVLRTLRDAVEDRVKGLDSGANDYLVKPFSLQELSARLRAMTRNSFGSASNILSVADLELDYAAHIVKRGGKEIPLSAKEYALLEYLMLNRGKILSREKIENHIWNFDYEGGTNVVDVYISYLRRKIDEGHKIRLIHTVRGRGYVLREEGAK